VTVSGYVPDPAGWIFLAGDTISVGAAVPDDSPLLPELWHLVGAKTDASAVLDALTRGGISSTPDFVIVALGAKGKVLVRGAATLTVEGSEQKTLTGAGFSSWAELVLDRVDRFSCEIVAAPGAVRLPLLGGAVRASSFAADVRGVAAFARADAVAAAVPVAAEAVVAPVSKGLAHAARSARAPATTSTPSAPSEATVAAVDEVEDDAPIDDVLVEVAPVEPAGKPSAYDHLFGDTSYRTVEEAAVRPAADNAGESPAATGIEDRTVVASDLAQLRAKRRAGRVREVVEAAPAPAFFVELSTGGHEPLDQPLVIGRAPNAAALGGDRIPRLITMTTPNQDISRTHAQITVEGGTVVVTDLHSRNGTIVTLPGRAAQKLREGETTPVIPGTIIDLGDGATLTVREA
jgi:hypothetical protein